MGKNILVMNISQCCIYLVIQPTSIEHLLCAGPLYITLTRAKAGSKTRALKTSQFFEIRLNEAKKPKDTTCTNQWYEEK